MRSRRYLLVLLLASTPALTFAAAPGVEPQTNIVTVAREATHFATQAIIENRPLWGTGFITRSQSDLKDLMTEQEVLANKLTILGWNPLAMRQRLKDPDARIRTIALGALFNRDDPQDLPFIAALMSDPAQAIPALHDSGSAIGPGPLSAMEHPQTVGEIARAMVGFYLEAASIRNHLGETPEEMYAVFQSYWAERSDRKYCASWFLVKLQRANQPMDRTQLSLSKDGNAVMAEVAALPSPEQAWTLFFLGSRRWLPGHALDPDTVLLQAASTIGPDALMNFLQFKTFSTDPDLHFSDAPSNSRSEVFLPMSRFVLRHATQLLRAKDASILRGDAFKEWQRYNSSIGEWLAAADSLDAAENPGKGVAELKADMARFPKTESWSDEGAQIILAINLWRLGGAKEADFLTSWFYTLPRTENPSLSEDFLHSVWAEHRADTPAFLRAIVADKKFETTNWSVLVQLINMAGTEQKTPLIDGMDFYNHQPNRLQTDQPSVLASWRSLLRRHYGLPDVSETV